MTTRPMPVGISPDALLGLHQQAADWYVRRQQPGWTAADERAMADWLGADPLHRDIMDGLDSTWQQADLLKAFRPQSYGSRVGVPAIPSPKARAPFFASLSRRGFLVPALTVAGAALVFGGWQRWDNTASYSLDIATGRGEIRTVDLPDGSRIDLNVASALRVRLYPRRREVVLEHGEAFFKVASDADRPFTVDAGPTQVKVIGTAFNVRAASPKLIVQVQEGRVEVRADRREPAGSVLLLHAGTGVDIESLTGRYQNINTVADGVGGWRSGQVHFSRTPLNEVAQELARYLGQTVTVEGADVQVLRISGFLAIKAPEDFIHALPDVVPVRVDRLVDGSWRIARR